MAIVENGSQDRVGGFRGIGGIVFPHTPFLFIIFTYNRGFRGIRGILLGNLFSLSVLGFTGFRRDVVGMHHVEIVEPRDKLPSLPRQIECCELVVDFAYFVSHYIHPMNGSPPQVLSQTYQAWFELGPAFFCSRFSHLIRLVRTYLALNGGFHRSTRPLAVSKACGSNIATRLVKPME